MILLAGSSSAGSFFEDLTTGLFDEYRASKFVRVTVESLTCESWMGSRDPIGYHGHRHPALGGGRKSTIDR